MKINKILSSGLVFRLSMISIIVCFLTALPAPVKGAPASVRTVIRVDTLQDELNVDGKCSLREAIRAANLNAVVDSCPAGTGPDTIVLDSGIFVLNIAGTGEDNALTGDLDIREDIYISGSGANQTIIDGNGIDRVFHIVSGNSVKMNGITIQGGSSPAGEFYGGGGILNMSSTLDMADSVIMNNISAKTGGGIDNDSTTLLQRVTLKGNSSRKGGAIYNGGTLNLSQVVLYSNQASDTGGGLDNSYFLTIIDTTISGNQAGYQGGGVFNDGESVTLLNSTIADNSTGVYNAAGEIRFKNTIVAGSTVAENCLGTGSFQSQGHNLDSDGTCKFDSRVDLIGVSPQLGPLQDNGGKTLTHALLSGSPAIDSGDNIDCPTTDQRGAARPGDGDGNGAETCDIGAFEKDGRFDTLIFLPVVIH